MHIETGQLVGVFALVVGAIAIGGAAQRFRISSPILLVLAGLAVSFVPGVPDYTLNPEIVLFFFLPPLLYSAAWTSSLPGIKQNLRSIGLLSVGLVIATTVVVGLTAYALIPDMPLAAAFALGAIVGPPDAVAATAVGRELGLPRRMLTILQGESLVNDATALTLLRVAIAAVGGSITLLEGAFDFAVAAGGGVAIGLVLGIALNRLRRLVSDRPVLENAISLLVPFVVFLLAEIVHASGVLAVVVAGLYLGHTSSATSYSARLQGYSTWEVIDFVLESVVFALIGLQLPAVVGDLGDRPVGQLVWWSVAVLAVTIAIRVLWMYPGTYLPRYLSKRIREREPSPPWQYPTVLSWAGMRGVVSLAAAFSLEADFPARGLIIFLTFVVVFGTLVIQGLTLPAVIRRLGVVGTESYTDRLAEANAQHRAARAAVARLDQLVEESDDDLSEDVVDKLRTYAENRSNGAWERLGGGSGMDGAETPTASFRRLRQEMVRAERDVFVEMRNAGELDDEVMREVVRELDLEEAMLSGRDERLV